MENKRKPNNKNKCDKFHNGINLNNFPILECINIKHLKHREWSVIFSISIKRKKNQSQRKKNQDTHNKVRNKDSGYLNNKVNNPQYLINCIHFLFPFF